MLCIGASPARGARAAAALLLGAPLLLLLAAPPAPRRPLPRPALNTSGLELFVNATLPSTAAWIDEDDEAQAAGVARVRDRYVAGHARAHPELCAERGARTRLTVLVASAPGHARQRMGIRLTWGHAARRADVAFAFVLGAPPPHLRAAVDAEDALYGDLVEGRYVDSYGNLTLKTVSMLEWFVTYCPQAATLLKADDDVFVNVGGVLRFAEAPERRGAEAVWGKEWRAGRPVRDPTSKFFVPPEEFPGTVYPPYANGPAYLVAGRAAARLLRAALRARWLRMEDALVTGVAAAAARVRRADVPALLRRRAHVAAPCALRAALAVHQMQYPHQFELWGKLHDPAAHC